MLVLYLTFLAASKMSMFIQKIYISFNIGFRLNENNCLLHLILQGTNIESTSNFNGQQAHKSIFLNFMAEIITRILLLSSYKSFQQKLCANILCTLLYYYNGQKVYLKHQRAWPKLNAFDEKIRSIETHNFVFLLY